MAESAVEFVDSGRKVRFEDVDKGEIGTSAQGIVIHLGCDTTTNGFGIGTVATAGPFDAQFYGCEDGDDPIDRIFQPCFVEDGALQHDIIGRLSLGPCREIPHDGRMHDGIQVGERLRIGEDDSGKTSTVEFSFAVYITTETCLDRPAQLRGHQSFGFGIRIVDRNSLGCEKATNGALAAADAARNSHPDHFFGFFAGASISGTERIATTLISLNFKDMAFCND